MDIIDVLLAKALSPQGQVETYAAKAAKAASDAATAVANSETAINNINSITEETTQNNALALETVAAVNDALADLETALTNLEVDPAQVGQEIDKLDFSINSTTTTASVNNDIKIDYPSGKIVNLNNVVKMYQASGLNTDGTMTQKAITNFINDVKTELNNKIISNSSSSTGGTTNLGPDNEGMIVVVGDNGNIIAGDTSEIAIIEALIRAGAYTAKNAVGLELDYENKAFARTQESTYYTMGSNFNKYPMFGGRRRCIVNNEGRIVAFYGDANYTEDGSLGQVMVYQPKFYYQRIPMKIANLQTGPVIRKESLVLSATKQAGFKIHPLFVNEDGEEIEYVLLSAYEGSLYDTTNNTYDLNDVAHNMEYVMLSSIAGAKPVSGKNQNFNLMNAERAAQARGTGWHITNMKAESANQMLEMVEFGTANGQAALELGISTITPVANMNCSSITGSTTLLGNTTGAAASTINEANGKYTTHDTVGKRAISYRGVENPWGNIWRMVGDLLVEGDGTKQGGELFICNNYNYNNTVTNDYQSVNLRIPSVYNWISGFGYNDNGYDWLFIPVECSSTANSALPIGDSLWSSANLNGTHMVMCGGNWVFDESNGPFYYACDKQATEVSRSFSARLMFIPSKDSIYAANYNDWLTQVGG